MSKYLTAYSAVVTLAFLGSTALILRKQDTPRELTVERLNVVEKDGTLRYVLASAGRFPGAIVKGKEYKHDRGVAGMLFYNAEGTENGGLIFDGRDGGSGGGLTFDAYEQDQLVQIIGEKEGSTAMAGMFVNDRPERSIVQDLEDHDRFAGMDASAIYADREKKHYWGESRLFVGRNKSAESVLNLKDANGKPRLVLKVTALGAASIEFLDDAGKVVRTLGPEAMLGKL